MRSNRIRCLHNRHHTERNDDQDGRTDESCLQRMEKLTEKVVSVVLCFHSDGHLDVEKFSLLTVRKNIRMSLLQAS